MIGYTVNLDVLWKIRDRIIGFNVMYLHVPLTSAEMSFIFQGGERNAVASISMKESERFYFQSHKVAILFKCLLLPPFKVVV